MNEKFYEVFADAEYAKKLTGYTRQDFFNQKFAELIVQECANLFPLQHTNEQYSRRIDKTILKHFGMYP
jgi:hypothetical protein